jgi:predicted O-methyltransferase YrrM
MAVKNSSRAAERRQLETALESIESFVSMDESWLLYEAARQSRSGRVAEIGSHKGRSTIALAMGVMARGGGSVVAVDPFDDEIDGESGDFRLQQFQENLIRAGVAEYVVLRRKRSHEIADNIPGCSLDVLFVDGSHEYEDVVQDVDDWLPKMVDGGLMVFNDPVIPQVGWALRDRVATRGSSLRGPALVRNSLVTQYLPNAPWRLSDGVRRLRLRLALPMMWRFVQFVERQGAGHRLQQMTARGAYALGRALFVVLLPPGRIEPKETVD